MAEEAGEAGAEEERLPEAAGAHHVSDAEGIFAALALESAPAAGGAPEAATFARLGHLATADSTLVAGQAPEADSSRLHQHGGVWI